MNSDLFGVRLKEKREARGITQKALSEESGVNAANISSYEKGINKPSLEIACRLADALGVSLQSLVSDEYDINQKQKSVLTYSDIIVFFDTLIKCNTSNTDIEFYIEELSDDLDECLSSIEIRFGDIVFCMFVKKWRELRELLEKKTIDVEIYDAWLEKQIATWDKPINSKE